MKTGVRADQRDRAQSIQTAAIQKALELNVLHPGKPAKTNQITTASPPRKNGAKTARQRSVPPFQFIGQHHAGLIKSGPISVPVKVRLDPAGKIISAKAMGSAPKLAKKAAVSFVKSIRWRPARQGDKNVKFNLVYTVKFRP